MAWAGQEDLQRSLNQATSTNYGAASHFEVFPTLLVLMGYDAESVRKRYHISLFDPIDTPLGYTSGSITGRFGKAPHWNPRFDPDQLVR